MATYTLSKYQLNAASVNVGSPFGKVPITLITIEDEWIKSVTLNDSIVFTYDVVSRIKEFTDKFPTISSLGGSSSDIASSDFAGVNYPITSTPVTVGTYVTVSSSITSRNGVISLDLFLDSNPIRVFSNRGSQGLRNTWILTDDSGTIYSSDTPISADLRYPSDVRAYHAASSNNGLPYDTSLNTSIYDTQDYARVISHIGGNIKNAGVEVKTGNPYESGGTSSSGGGQGTFDNTSDKISIPDLPTISATDTKFLTLFTPSLSQVQALANYLWSDLFSLDSWKKLFDNPMDAVIGFSVVPVTVPKGNTTDVTVGNAITTVSMTQAASQYVEVDCGTLDVKEYWGGYLDYAPYTKCEIYLPYCGCHEINVDEVMNKSVHIVYHVDILSGACCAYISCDDTLMYTFTGVCATQLPITQNDWSAMQSTIVSSAILAGGLIATGGLSAPMVGGTLGASVPTIEGTLNATGTAAFYQQASDIANATAVGSAIMTKPLSDNKTVEDGSISGTMRVGQLLATAPNVMNSKPRVSRSGSMGSMTGMLAPQKPYMILTRPRQCTPENQQKYTGFPSLITSKVSDLEGFTIFSEIHLDNISATETEKSQIEQMLYAGVIL